MTNTAIELPASSEDTLSPGYRLFQKAAFAAYGILAAALLIEVLQGAAAFGLLWMIPVTAVVAYVAADFISGFVHFLADNFGGPDTPFVGKTFVQPFREHHDDPKAILAKPFFISNGNNCVVTVPYVAAVLLLVPVDSSRAGYLIGAFSFFLANLILLTNQFHKWAHMDEAPAAVRWLQDRNLVLSKEHHDIHHVSPFDTHYCITVGWLNPLLQRIRFFERTERLLRGVLPGKTG
jgi:ubiquitin-conjugating enzyme E2 variant